MTVGVDYGCVAILGLKQIFILLNCPKTYRPAILIHPGQGGPLFGQDQGSTAVPASAPAATMASAWTRNHLQFRHWDKNNHVFAFTGLPFQCQIENRPKNKEGLSKNNFMEKHHYWFAKKQFYFGNWRRASRYIVMFDLTIKTPHLLLQICSIANRTVGAGRARNPPDLLRRDWSHITDSILGWKDEWV